MAEVEVNFLFGGGGAKARYIVLADTPQLYNIFKNNISNLIDI